MPRPTLASLLEDFRNWNKTQDWMLNKQRDIYGNEDPDTIALNEKLAGIGTADMGMMGSSVGGLAAMLRASHGSPHLFNKFDFSKIGTGEGAQAYGHGGYFAQGFDSPVAKDYQQALSAKEGMQPTINGKMLGEFYMNLERKANKLPPKLAEPEYEKLAFLEDLEQQPSFQHALDRIDDERIIPWAESLRSAYKPAGNLYNVELKWPDPAREAADPLGEHHLLDWDAPMSQQPLLVRKALSELNLPAGTYGENPVGAHAYAEMSKRLDQGDQELLQSVKQHPNLFAESPELVSAWLKSKGIPGIRYLDQASRGAGEGTRNYVMFDDALANIVSRNGVSLSDLLKTSESPQNKLDAIIQNLESQGLKIDASYNPNKQQISLSRLVVPQEMRSQGVGTKAMQDLVNFADEQNALMQLSPSTDFGATSLNRLKDFYKRFGFVPNTGKYKDYSISESMYRPKK